MLLFLLTLAVVVLAVLGMAAGTLLSGRCLRGTCGGVWGPDSGDRSLRCAGCPRRLNGGSSPR